MFIRGYVHINFEEAFYADVVEIVSKNKITKYDNYVGYMELINGDMILVYNVDGKLKGIEK